LEKVERILGSKEEGVGESLEGEGVPITIESMRCKSRMAIAKRTY